MRWGLEPILAQEGPTLVPFTEVPKEVEENDAMVVQEDGATAEYDTIAE